MKKLPIPAFLKKFDRYLLENYPLLWTVKLHYILAIAVATTIPAGLLVMMKPISHTNIPSPEGWFITLLIIRAKNCVWDQARSSKSQRMYCMSANAYRTPNA